MLFQRVEKVVCCRLDTCGVLISFIFARVLPGVLNFQRVQNLLGVQLRSFRYAIFFSLKDDLTSHIEDPL